MNILKAVLENEVFPALGCTEPIAVAYATSIASRELSGEIQKITMIVDPGVYKNGFAVTVPNTDGRKGNLIAGVLGALVREPELKMEILKNVTPDLVARAQTIIVDKKASIRFDTSKRSLFIDVTVTTSTGSARAVIAKAHTRVIRIEKDGEVLLEHSMDPDQSQDKSYRTRLKKMNIADFIPLVESMDDGDRAYLKKGIAMNLTIADAGLELKKVGHYVADLRNKGFLSDDVFSTSKILTASASDARMAGLNFPVMASGGSGNQGIVAILVPYNVGHWFKVREDIVLQSIGLSHLINSYIKCYTGDLSPLCGCAIAAGVGAAAAIVYQQCGPDMEKITLAINNLISDLGGMLCDGAKGGCAFKVASSTDSAIRAAYMAQHGHGITREEGFVGKTAEETIWNLSAIGSQGMGRVDDTMLEIMTRKI